jgi:hypothetical protein
MTDQAILDAIRASGVTANQLTVMLTKFVILMTVEEKRAELARKTAERDYFMQSFNTTFAAEVAPYNAAVDALKTEVAALETQAALEL